MALDADVQKPWKALEVPAVRGVLNAADTDRTAAELDGETVAIDRPDFFRPKPTLYAVPGVASPNRRGGEGKVQGRQRSRQDNSLFQVSHMRRLLLLEVEYGPNRGKFVSEPMHRMQGDKSGGSPRLS